MADSKVCYFCNKPYRSWELYDLFEIYPVCHQCVERITELFKDEIEAELEEEHEARPTV